jgi:hypothetical protein
MNEGVNRKFRELRQEAALCIYSGCKERAYNLAFEILQADTPGEVSVLKIEHKQGPRKLKPVLLDFMDWDFHYVVEHEGQIYDPLVGKPLSTDAYFDGAFVGSKREDLKITRNNPLSFD